MPESPISRGEPLLATTLHCSLNLDGEKPNQIRSDAGFRDCVSSPARRTFKLLFVPCCRLDSGACPFTRSLESLIHMDCLAMDKTAKNDDQVDRGDCQTMSSNAIVVT